MISSKLIRRKCFPTFIFARGLAYLVGICCLSHTNKNWINDFWFGRLVQKWSTQSMTWWTLVVLINSLAHGTKYLRIITCQPHWLPVYIYTLFLILLCVYFFIQARTTTLDQLAHGSRSPRAQRLLDRIRGTAIQSLCRYLNYLMLFKHYKLTLDIFLTSFLAPFLEFFLRTRAMWRVYLQNSRGSYTMQPLKVIGKA